MNIKYVGIAAAAVVASTATAGLEVGDTFTVSRLTTSPGRLVTINYDGSISSSSSASRSGGDAAQAGAQQFSWLKTNGSDLPGGIYLMGFCVEVAEAFPDDPIQYTVADLTSVPEEAPPGNMSANQALLIQDLYAKNYADILDTSNDGSWGDTSDEVAAFQLVIWEISHESFSSSDLAGMAGELSITLGAFQATNTFNANVATIAGGMISGLGVGGFDTFAVLGGTNPTNQDLLIVVPSPAIAALAGLGLVGMRRRRR
jgi:hypothetical protein